MADKEPGGRTPSAGHAGARQRMALLVAVAATSGRFSARLSAAVAHATDEEVQIMSDLLARGMAVPDLVSFLQGAHTVVGDDELYHRWIFPGSRARLSSHHRDVDKSATPDYGYGGPLVREALHGKIPSGTWIQLERTKATFRPGRWPTWTDLVHIRDYVLYRLTGKNVGPWGLSAYVDTRPIVLRPRGAVVGGGVSAGLGALTRHRAAVDQSQRWTDLLSPDVEAVGPSGHLFRPPAPQDPLDLLPDEPYGDDLGLGLFGSLPIVRATARMPGTVLGLLADPADRIGLGTPHGEGEVVALPWGGAELRLRGTVTSTDAAPAVPGLEEGGA